MILAFRKNDYAEISRIALEVGRSINDLILDASRDIKINTNYYTNPRTMKEFNEIEFVDITMNDVDFKRLVDNADYSNMSLEVYIVGIIKMFRNLIVLNEKKINFF